MAFGENTKLKKLESYPREYLQLLLDNSKDGESINLYVSSDNDFYLATDRMEPNLRQYVKDVHAEFVNMMIEGVKAETRKKNKP